MELYILSLVIVAVAFIIWKLSRKPTKFPPGPPRWPLLGNILEIRKWGSSPHLSVAEVCTRYGEVAGFYLGNSPIVVISGLVNIHEISKREDLAGRVKNPYHMFSANGRIHGITSTIGNKWHEHRGFTLRNLDRGTKKLEEIVHGEIKAVLSEMERLIDGKDESRITPVQDILGMANLNTLLSLVIGKRFDYSDPTLRKIMHNIRKIWSITDTSGGLFVVFPLILQKFSPNSKVARVKQLYNWLQYFFEEEFDNHKKTFKSSGNRDYVDAFIKEMMEQDNDSESTFTETQLIATCFELLASGMTTTYNTLAYALLYMVLYPEIQCKVQEELDNVVGPNRLPTLGDRPKLCYTEATLLEVFRRSCVCPLSIPHASFHPGKDVTYREYIIPKNARVILNIYGLHHDPKVWIDPLNFRPARFLDEEGKVAEHDALMPFGIGTRSCVGEKIAHNTLLLFFSALMLNYTFKIPHGESRPAEDPVGHFLLSPPRFSVQMLYRNQNK